MTYKILAVVALVVGAYLFNHYMLASSDAAATRLMTKSDCVVETAIAQGYAGDPYSEEAWNTFGPTCD